MHWLLWFRPALDRDEKPVNWLWRISPMSAEWLAEIKRKPVITTED